MPTAASLALPAVFLFAACLRLFAANPRADKGEQGRITPGKSGNEPCAQRGKLAIFQEAQIPFLNQAKHEEQSKTSSTKACHIKARSLPSVEMTKKERWPRDKTKWL